MATLVQQQQSKPVRKQNEVEVSVILKTLHDEISIVVTFVRINEAFETYF